MEAVLNRRVGGKPLSLWIIAFLAASTAWLASGDTTQCASAASCQTTDNEVFGAGATFNEDRGSAADNDVVVHGDTVDELVDVDASADTTFFNGTVDASAATAIGFSNLVGITEITTTSTYNVPTGVSTLLVYCTGGGGGGGGYDNVTDNVAGGGGGGGGTGVALVDASGTASYSVTIGAGGTGGAAANNGTSGGSTTFASECTGTGGGGGFGNPGGLGGSGGSGTVGDFSLDGTDGQTFNSSDNTSSTPRGNGGSTWRGSGSGAGGDGGSSGSMSGLAGIDGSVVILEFS